MGTTIVDVKTTEIYPKILENFLPRRITDEIKNTNTGIGRIEEIRLRANSRVALTTDRGNILLRGIMSSREMNETLHSMCGYSLYAHSDTINNGYITLSGGIRVGVAGRASMDCGRVIGIYDISSLNIRIPKVFRGFGKKICDILRNSRSAQGVLIYSPPGVGKTTLLRSVAYKMASGYGARRVCIIDSRGELGIYEEQENASIDILSGYPKGTGIEIAARTMNSQLMVCDEIGDAEEARAIIYAQNCGVPLLASAHGENIKGLLSRPAIMELHRAGVFGTYVRIERGAAGGDYKYTVTTAEVADELFQNSGRVDSDR